MIDTRMDKGRAFYLAMHEKDGAIWDANEHKQLWCDMAEDYERRLAAQTVAVMVPHLTDEQVEKLKREWVQPGDLKLVMVPRDLYYHEVEYVRGLQERIQTLAALNVEFQHALRNATTGIKKLATALRRIRSLEKKNVEKYAQQIAGEAIDE